jgi:hypothetical protein
MIAAGLSVQAQKAGSFTGAYRIDMPGKYSDNTTRERIDSRTVLRTDSSTMGSSVRGMGTLEIKANGTFVLHDLLGYGKLRTGRWMANEEGPFSDRGGLKLLDVRPPDQKISERQWYVFINDNGEVEARESPFTTYNSYRLTKTSGAPLKPNAKAEVTAVPAPKAKPAAVAKKELTQGEIYKLQNDITAFLTGKTQSQVEAELGKATAKNDPDGYSQEFSLVGADLAIDNFPHVYTVVSLQFNAPPALGGKVKYVVIR